MVRRAFTIIEVIVIVAIMVILAAVITPNLVGVLDRQRISGAVETMNSIISALDSFNKDVGKLAGFLTQLVEPITLSDSDACGVTYDQKRVDAWKGPYFARNIASFGVPMGIGTVGNQVIRDNVVTKRMILQIPQVTEEDAIAFNAQVDGDGSSTGGTVRWTTPDATGLVTVTYLTAHGTKC